MNIKKIQERHVSRITTYLNEYEMQVLTALTIETQNSVSKILRQAIMEMAERRLGGVEKSQ